MNWKDFLIVGDDYITERELQVGDFFQEDTYPEVYQVTCRRVHEEYNVEMVIAKCITDGREEVEFYNCSSLLLLEKK